MFTGDGVNSAVNSAVNRVFGVFGGVVFRPELKISILSSALRKTLVGAMLPAELCPHAADATTVFEELRDGLLYRETDAGRHAVEESRAYFLAPWCGYAHPPCARAFALAPAP